MMKSQADTAGAITVRRSGASERREVLRALSLELRGLHRELIDVSRERYELANGPVGSRADLLDLLLRDEAFAWLRSLSSLIVEIDELVAEDGALTEAEAGEIRAHVEALLSASDDRGSFGSRYVALLASEPRVAMSHLGVRGALVDLEASQTREPDRSGNHGHTG